MFWFKKKDNNDNRITFGEWYGKHCAEHNTTFTVIVKPTGFKLCFKVTTYSYLLDYKTVVKYGNRKVLHEFLVVGRQRPNEWVVVLGDK